MTVDSQGSLQLCSYAPEQSKFWVRLIHAVYLNSQKNLHVHVYTVVHIGLQSALYISTLQGRHGVSDIFAKMIFLHISMCISSSMMYSYFRVQNLFRMKVRSSKNKKNNKEQKNFQSNFVSLEKLSNGAYTVSSL